MVGMSIFLAASSLTVPEGMSLDQHIEKEHLPQRMQYNNQTYTAYKQCPLIDRGNDIIKDSGTRWNNRIIYVIEKYLPNEIFIQNPDNLQVFYAYKNESS
ncbi:MAG: hypothetical protein OIN66_06340 [Candidatus Methanoperedens sp.]|nr:hypothetical protein [Candidatus Methanoperedens sp.]